MCFDLQQAAQALTALEPSQCRRPHGPIQDYIRGPAAALVGMHAADQGLFLFHFEHREALVLPPAFVAPGFEEQATPPEWRDGVLPEAKYQSFRHDLTVGSFHPGHRSKWTTHELCHALVGFGWKPNASQLFHATACRLAELLPVVLYYFLDEVRLRRCPDHAGGGALFREFCPVCEDLAQAGVRPWNAQDDRALLHARDYLDAELAAVARTRRTGRPVAHRWGSLDLCTDGLAYAAAHGTRLRSAAFHRFAERFLVDDGGYCSTLDALEERVVAVTRAISEGAPLAPMAESAEQGRWRWTVQDIAWRMLWACEDVSPDAARAGRALVDALAASDWDADAVCAARQGWEAAEDSGLPLAEQVFAVGYALPDDPGASLHQVHAGLQTAAPLTLELFEDVDVDPVPAFASDDALVRRPLGDRFADWVADHHPGVADLTRYEAALRHGSAGGYSAVLGEGTGPLGWEVGVRVLHAQTDPVALFEAVTDGAIQGGLVDGALILQTPEGQRLESSPTVLAIRRSADGNVAIVEVDKPTDECLRSGNIVEDEETLEALRSLGMVAPSAWTV